MNFTECVYMKRTKKIAIFQICESCAYMPSFYKAWSQIASYFITVSLLHSLARLHNLIICFVDFVSVTSTVEVNNSTDSFICNFTNGTDDLKNITNDTDDHNSATTFVTSTIDVTITGSATVHPISSRAPNVTIDTAIATNSSNHSSNKAATPYLVIAFSLASGLLGVFCIVRIVGLLLKRKCHKNHKTNSDFTLSPVSLLFDR